MSRAANLPIRVPVLHTLDVELPRELDGLLDLAYNLWWSWSPPVRQLFASIDREAWARYRNPVEMLLNVDRTRWEVLLGDESFLSALARARRRFESYLSPEKGTWFERRHPGYDAGPIAYFSMEYGLTASLAVYSGGLGVLSGDHCKSASDLGLPFVAVGLLYRNGYFQQTIDADGFQQHFYPAYDFHRLPIRPGLDPRGRELIVNVPLPEREVAARVWVAEIGRVPLLLLDTDLPRNDPADRPISGALYVRGREMRLVQELVLGIGGVRALAALGIEPAVWHLNEGHSALLQLERIAGRMVSTGADFEGALKSVSGAVAFTTHTAVAAGNERFDAALARPYLEPWEARLPVAAGTFLALGDPANGDAGPVLDLTAFALRTSSLANGVSRIHGEISDHLWRHLHPERPPEEPAVGAITNGVHLPTWVGLEIRELLRERLGEGWPEAILEPGAEELLAGIGDRELWTAHLLQKERLLRFTRARLLVQAARHGASPGQLRQLSRPLDPAVLTIGFARRFATYKRAALLFYDLDRLRSLLSSSERPLRVLLAGKAHPADRPGQELIRNIFQLSQSPELRSRVIFVENYDMRAGAMLVQGVDLWLNTPRRPHEACGTSGQKAAANGVVNCSVLDGWWPEAYDGTNGWAFGDGDDFHGDERQQDERDAAELYRLLEEEILPAYYERDGDGLPVAWIERMRRSLVTVAPRFGAHRMVRDYLDEVYLPLAGSGPGSPADPEPGDTVSLSSS